MSVRGHAASEGTAPGNFYADEGAWAMDPPEPDPLEIVIWSAGDDGYQGILSEVETDAYVDLDGNDLEGLRDLAIPLENCR